MSKEKTEDDTFNALRRAPLSDAIKLYNRIAGCGYTEQKLNEIGWTFEEFHRKLIEIKYSPL